MRGGERISKVFLDSRYCLPDGSIEIPGGGLLLDPSDRCWLAEFSTVASWDTIDESNDTLFVIEAGNVLRRIPLGHGAHDLDSLASDMQARLNGAGKTLSGSYSVQRVSSGQAGSTFRNYLVWHSSGQFQLPGEAQIRAIWFNGDRRAVTNSTNTLFAFPTGDTFAADHRSGFVDLRRVHSIYIHAPGFGSGNCVGVTGARDILAKVPCDVGYGGAIHWYMSGSEHDSVECGVNPITLIKIEPRDVAGNLIDLNGTHWSATILFDR